MMLHTARHVVALSALWLGMAAHAKDMPLFDAHIHYSHDAWAQYPASTAIERLRAAGVMRALVSSSNDDGTQQL